MVLSLLLFASMAFAQDAEAPAEAPPELPTTTEAPAPAAMEAPAAPPITTPTSEMNPAAQGQFDASMVDFGLKPGLIGGVAGFCPGALCVCLGAGGCIGTTVYYFKADAPIPVDTTMQPGAYMEAYNKELQKRQAMQALIGGSVGVAAALGLNVVLGFALGYF